MFEKYIEDIKKLMVGLLLIGSAVVWDYERIGDWIRTGKTKWILLAAAIYGGIKISEKWSSHAIGFLFSICILSFLWFNSPVISFIDLFCITAVFFIVPFIFLEDIEFIVNCIIFVCAINSAMALLQLFGLNPIWLMQGNWIINSEVGFLGHPTIYGPLMVCGVSCSLYGGIKGNKILLALSILMAIQCFFTASVMTVLSLGAVLILYAYEMWSKKKAYLLFGLSILACIILEIFLPRAMSDTGRFWWWGEAFKMFKNAPLLGYGIGTWQSYAMFIGQHNLAVLGNSPWFGQAHNDYVQAAFELGLIGLAIIGWCFYDVIMGAVSALSIKKDSIRFAGIFLGLAVNSLGNFPIRIAPLALLFAMSAYYFMSKQYEKGMLPGGIL